MKWKETKIVTDDEKRLARNAQKRDYYANWGGKEKSAEYSRKYYMEHADEYIARSKKYRAEHREEYRAYQRAYYWKNREKINARKRERYRQKCRIFDMERLEKQSAYQRAYRARKKAEKLRKESET